MTARHSLDQIERGLDGVTPDHERVWLQNANDAHGCEGRLWCQDKVWPEDDEQGEPTEYVRADLFRDLEERLAKAAEALEFYANPEIYKPHPHGPAFDRRDVSFCARTALSQIRSEK